MAPILGLIAEQAVEAVHKQASEFVTSGVNLDKAPYLGPVLADSKGTIQWIQEHRLLPEGIRELLFGEMPATTHGED